jgi:hypothetical protein
MKAEGIPIFEALIGIDDVNELPRQTWPALAVEAPGAPTMGATLTYAGGGWSGMRSVEEGGTLIESEGEDPQVRKDFERPCAASASNARCRQLPQKTTTLAAVPVLRRPGANHWSHALPPP